MSAVPAWKQAILERKRQQEEAERKKQQEKEQYLASLPPWKRAMMKKKEDEAKGTANPVVKDVKEDHSSSRSSPLIKPKIEKSAVSSWKQKTEATKEKNETPMYNNISSTPVEKEVSKPKGITQSLKGKFEQTSVNKVETVPVKQPVAVVERIEKKEEKPQDKEEQVKPSEESKTSTQGVEQSASPKSRPNLVQARRESVDIDDDKLKSMPKWKQDLIRRKRQQQQAPSTSKSPQTSPSIGHQKPSSTVDQKRPINLPNISIGTSHSTAPSTSPTSKSPPVSPFEKDKPKEVPEVVNASGKGDPDSPKLLHKEGKELKPPVYKVKNKWADMDENDPEFQNLPEWKRTLILRRKNDFKNRTAPPKKEEKPKEEVKNEPLPAPLWTPTRSVTVVREAPKESEKVEEVNPLLDMRKNLRKVNRPKSPSQRREEARSQPLSKYNMKSDSEYNEKNDKREAEESLSPLKSPKKDKPRKLRRVSWSDTDLQKSLTVEFSYPKYSYHDYFDIDQDVVEEVDTGNVSEDSNELATPLHPWLSSPSNSPSNNAPQASSSTSSSSTSNTSSSFGSPTSFGMSGMGFGSLGSFMSAYTGGMSNGSYSSGGNSSPSQDKEPEKAKQNPIEQEDDNTAALIW